MGELETISAGLDALGVRRRNILVVPDCGGINPIEEAPEFVAFAREAVRNGAELCLHGLHHRAFEFRRLGYEEAAAALTAGIRHFTRAFGAAPAGFVAPQWLQSSGSLRAVRDAGFLYTETLSGIITADGRHVRARLLNNDWGSVLLDRMIMAAHRMITRTSRGGLIRAAIHPMDVINGLWDAELRMLSTLLDGGWTPVSYQHVCSPG